jgi:uncharacterized membrane protein YciS (DUF1049 family)
LGLESVVALNYLYANEEFLDISLLSYLSHVLAFGWFIEPGVHFRHHGFSRMADRRRNHKSFGINAGLLIDLQ